MDFNILDFLWFLVKLLGLSSLTLILISLIVTFINNIIDGFKKRKQEEILDNLIKQAIKEKNFNVDIVTNEEMKEIKKKANSKK